MDILPAIDLREGKCVRLLQGDYNQQIDYADDPVAVARSFEQAGTTWVHMVDLDGAREGRGRNVDVIERVARETSLSVEVGGGLRTTDAVEALIEAGVARCVIGTKALEDRAWFEELAQRPNCRGRIALGLDARDGRVAVHGWTQVSDLTATDFVQQIAHLPLAAIIYTDISRDGMMQGPNVEATGAMARASNIPVIASGGVTRADDVRQLKQLPLLGIIIGRAIYEKTIDLAEALAIVRNT